MAQTNCLAYMDRIDFLDDILLVIFFSLKSVNFPRLCTDSYQHVLGVFLEIVSVCQMTIRYRHSD